VQVYACAKVALDGVYNHQSRTNLRNRTVESACVGKRDGAIKHMEESRIPAEGIKTGPDRFGNRILDAEIKGASRFHDSAITELSA
jgi:hypothetical protein